MDLYRCTYKERQRYINTARQMDIDGMTDIYVYLVISVRNFLPFNGFCTMYIYVYIFLTNDLFIYQSICPSP